ncbi:MAG: TerB family tellurite resistance protein [Pseudomonadota bacterium]
MLRSIQEWFHSLSRAGEGEEPFSAVDPKLSVAAILVHIIAVDGVVTDDEKRRLRDTLSAHFNLSAEETEKLVTEAATREGDAVDLYSFTSVLKRDLDEVGRRDVVAMMWEMVYADGEVSEFEDNVVWRVAELIGVSGRERIAIRQQIEAKRAAG